MAQALFDINADGGNQGFAATNSQVLTLRLRQQPPLGVATVLFQVFNPAGFDPTLRIAANPPRASLAAPALTVVGATSGPSASPATVDGSVTITMPATGSHSWIVRCVVNGGFRTLPGGQQVVDPTLIHERGVYIPTVLGARKVVCTELRQFSDGGWADALGNIPDLIVTDHSVPLVKLPLAAKAPSVVGATANGNFVELEIEAFRGVGMTTSSGKFETRPRARRVSFVESFTFGTLVSGNIGDWGWNLFGQGTPTVARVDSGLLNSQRITLITSNAVNDRATLCVGDTESRNVIAPPETKIAQLYMRSVLTNRRIFFGFQGDLAASPIATLNCLGFLYDSTVSPNWQLLARSSNVGSPVVTSTPMKNDVAELLTIYQATPGSYSFYTDATLLGTISSGVPAAEINFGAKITALTAAIAQLKLGRIVFDSMSLTGASAADVFLEA